MRELIFVAIGGAVGAVCRYALSSGTHRLLGDGFPYGTLLVNVLGCLAIGVAAEASRAYPDSFTILHQRGIAVGYLGALTTFSTFGFETLRRFEQGEWGIAFGNIAANLLIGLAAVAFGLTVGRWLFVK